MADDILGSGLKESREKFRVYIQNETDPVKQKKLTEFLPYIDKALDQPELDWFRTKAIQTADAARALLERAWGPSRHT